MIIFPLTGVCSTKKQVAQRRCRLREMALVHWLLSAVVNSRLSLFDSLEQWAEILSFLREPIRKKRHYQQDILSGGRFG